MRPREKSTKEQGQAAGRKETMSKHTFECNFNKCTAWEHFSFFSFLFPFASPRRKPIQGQNCVVLARPCVQRHVLLHYLEEVTEQLDLKLSKSKPHSVIHGCQTVCRAYRIPLPAQEKSSGAASAHELLHSAFGQGLCLPCTAERSGESSLKQGLTATPALVGTRQQHYQHRNPIQCRVNTNNNVAAINNLKPIKPAAHKRMQTLFMSTSTSAQPGKAFLDPFALLHQ